jgi:hypothetical protein
MMSHRDYKKYFLTEKKNLKLSNRPRKKKENMNAAFIPCIHVKIHGENPPLSLISSKGNPA